MKDIYIFLIYLPSTFGDLTQKFTKYKYTHVALSLDETYDHFYAFSRTRLDAMAVSGYMEEKRIYFTGGNHTPAQVKIFKLPVNQKQYRTVVRFIRKIKNDPEVIYNLINMLLLPWLGGYPVYKAYNCGEFIAKIIERAGIKLHKPYYQYMPKYFDELLKEYEIFEGTMEITGTVETGDDFFKKTPRLEFYSKTIFILYELIYRQLFRKVSRNYKAERVRLKK